MCCKINVKMMLSSKVVSFYSNPVIRIFRNG
nr:MAG TPA: hypothetical protein [Inoviridae sp.]